MTPAPAPEPETPYTPLELWRAVAALRINLTAPLYAGEKFLAGAFSGGRRLFGWGESPTEAVAALLRRIGEEND
jgi:hypothetical protein